MNEKICCLLILFVIVNVIKCNDNLRVAYEWKQIEFQYRNAIDRDNTIHNKNNVIPVGLEVYKSRLFITLPRWREGVPASLAYLDLNGWFFYIYNNLYTYAICLVVFKIHQNKYTFIIYFMHCFSFYR